MSRNLGFILKALKGLYLSMMIYYRDYYTIGQNKCKPFYVLGGALDHDNHERNEKHERTGF